jgi:hypothetical protein
MVSPGSKPRRFCSVAHGARWACKKTWLAGSTGAITRSVVWARHGVEKKQRTMKSDVQNIAMQRGTLSLVMLFVIIDNLV